LNGGGQLREGVEGIERWMKVKGEKEQSERLGQHHNLLDTLVERPRQAEQAISPIASLRKDVPSSAWPSPDSHPSEPSSIDAGVPWQ
jgi:hypothetical protein